VHDNRHLAPQLPATEKIDFIFDSQTQKGAILRSWDEFMANRTPEVRRLYWSAPRFEDDNVFLPLQSADLWAWACRQWFEDGRPMVGDSMVIPKIPVSSKIPHQWTIMHYEEDTIVKALKGILEAQFPDVVIYDDHYRG
jgi:hypothetical protein